jgi:hypothetical protein
VDTFGVAVTFYICILENREQFSAGAPDILTDGSLYSLQVDDAVIN